MDPAETPSTISPPGPSHPARAVPSRTTHAGVRGQANVLPEKPSHSRDHDMSLGLRSFRLTALNRTFVRAASAGSLFALLLILRSPAHGQSFVSAAPTEQPQEYPPPPPEHVPAARSLAFSLAGASRPAGIAIAVDAEHTGLPQGSALPTRGASVLEVSRAFERLARPFGKVLAIAPPTMIVLNAHPAGENAYLGMPPAQVFRLLVASLDGTGWDALTGEKGLGAANLTTADEQAMFAALVPSGSLEVAAKSDINEGFDLSRRMELPAGALRSSRIRLAKVTRISLPTSAAGQQMHSGTDTPTRADAPHEYVVIPGPAPEEQAGFFAGVAARTFWRAPGTFRSRATLSWTRSPRCSSTCQVWMGPLILTTISVCGNWRTRSRIRAMGRCQASAPPGLRRQMKWLPATPVYFRTSAASLSGSHSHAEA